MSEESSTFFLSWQSAISGPYSIGEIRNMLRLGKVNSLYKINAGGNWLVLRDHLAELDRKARIPVPRVIPDAPEPAHAPPVQSAYREQAPPAIAIQSEGGDDTRANGIAITSFVLSLFFFIPYINGITALLSLIFGHLALAQMSSGKDTKMHGMVSLGLWITYVYVGFLSLSVAWSAFYEVPDLTAVYLMLHGYMLGIGLAALIGSGVLMLVVKLLANQLISLRISFVATLLPAAISSFGTLVILMLLASTSHTNGRVIASLGLFQGLIFVFQMLFWARIIKLSDGGELGLAHAAVASLFHTIALVFIGFLYGILIATLEPSSYKSAFNKDHSRINQPVIVTNQSVDSVSIKPTTVDLVPASKLENVERSVVRIFNMANKSRGTGFVVSKEGHIATNWHMVQNAETVKVVYLTRNSIIVKTANVVAKDEGLDLAIVNIPGLDLPPLTLADSIPEKGDSVIALGYPGESEDYIAVGDLIKECEKNRNLTLALNEPRKQAMSIPVKHGFYEDKMKYSWFEAVKLWDGFTKEQLGDSKYMADFQAQPQFATKLEILQHTAPINHGNSGGPLLDKDFRVIGINTAISLNFSNSGENITVTKSSLCFSSRITEFIQFANVYSVNMQISSSKVTSPGQ